MLSCEFESGPACFLKSLIYGGKEPNMAESTPSTRLGQWFMSKGSNVHNQSKINLNDPNKSYNQRCDLSKVNKA